MKNKMIRDYKYPSARCRVDEVFKQYFYKSVQNFYRFTDGVFNCTYLGKIFRMSAKYARQIILQCAHCKVINQRRRYRRKYHGLKLFQLKQLVVLSWKQAPADVYIDDLAVMWNIPVLSAQTYLNKRLGASEEEHKLKRPLSFSSPEEFYRRNGWIDEDGNWSPSNKTIGWKLKPELQAKNRTIDEVPWADDRTINAIGKAFAEGMDAEEIMDKYKIPDIQTFRHYVTIFSRRQTEKLQGTYHPDRSMKFMLEGLGSSQTGINLEGVRYEADR